MIEVIKHGQKKFKATCAHCGCEFTYEMQDVKSGGVTCPDCGYYIKHTATITDGISIYYPPNCRGIQFAPKTEYPPTTVVFNTTTDAKKNAAVPTKTQPDWTYKENTTTGVDTSKLGDCYLTQDVDLRAIRAFEESRHTEE